jgi:hypothetical protein
VWQVPRDDGHVGDAEYGDGYGMDAGYSIGADPGYDTDDDGYGRHGALGPRGRRAERADVLAAARRAAVRRTPMWPSPDRDRRLPTATELAGWGLFCSLLAVVLCVATGAGPERAASLGSLGLTSTAALWAAAAYGGDAPRPQRSGRPPTGA